MAKVRLRDLEDALMWVSGAPMGLNAAYIHRASGKIYMESDLDDFFEDEEIPEDLGDPEFYIEVPHKNELDLGRELAFAFVSRNLPDHYQDVEQFFRGPGAYTAFKDMLEREGLLEKWYEFENTAEDRALREWCEVSGIELIEE